MSDFFHFHFFVFFFSFPNTPESNMGDYEDMLSSGVSDEALGAAGVTTSVYLKVC